MVVRFAVEQQTKDATSTASTASTKVSGQSFDAGDRISVFAPNAGGGGIVGSYPHKDKRYQANSSNEFAAVQGGEIQYSSRDERLDFYVFYPAVGAGGEQVNLSDYTIGVADLRDQRTQPLVPYMYSNNARNYGAEDGTVQLSFKYVVSKVTVSVEWDTERYASLDDVVFYANGLKEGMQVDLKRNDPATLAVTSGGVDIGEGNPILFPVPSGQSQKVEFYLPPTAVTAPTIKLTFTKTVAEGGGTEEVYAVINSGSYTFAAGKAYSYSVRAGFTDGGPVSVSGTIQNWEPVDNGTTIPAGRQ